jgi:hypothetical protein
LGEKRHFVVSKSNRYGKTVDVGKKSALLLQLVTLHFPAEMKEIMQKNNGE